jgi:hypothetical protein
MTRYHPRNAIRCVLRTHHRNNSSSNNSSNNILFTAARSWAASRYTRPQDVLWFGAVKTPVLKNRQETVSFYFCYLLDFYQVLFFCFDALENPCNTPV